MEFIKPLKLLCCLCLFSPSAWSLSSDNQQPIELEADVVDVDQSRGIALYKGNVTLRQGSIKITADQILVNAKAGQLDSATISGKQSPARFEQTLDSGQQMSGQADLIEVEQGQERVLFKGNAQVNDGFNTISGPLIRYNSKAQKIVADTTGSDEGRVKMIFLPAPSNSEAE